MSRKIKAILFDLDGTLRINLPPAGEVFVDCVKGMEFNPSNEDRIRAERWEYLYFASSQDVKDDNEKFKDDRKGFWVNFTRRRLIALGLHKDKAADLAPHISDCMESKYRPQVQVPLGIASILKNLQEGGYTLGVVSNRDEPFHRELAELELTNYFKFTLAGGEVQSFKPEPLIFEHALNMAGTSAEETMYVGDNYFADVVGSLRAGLLPVLFDPDHLFPDAECAVIRSFAELPDLLK